MVLGKHWPTIFMPSSPERLVEHCSGPTPSQDRMSAQQARSLPSVTWQRTLGRIKPGLHGAGAQKPQGLWHHRRGHPPWPWKWSGGQADFLGEGVTEQRPDRMQQEGEQNR